MTEKNWAKAREIRELRDKTGLTYEKIGEKLGISRQRVHQVYQEAGGIGPGATPLKVDLFFPT